MMVRQYGFKDQSISADRHHMFETWIPRIIDIAGQQ